MLKQEMVPVQKEIAHLRAEALVDGALHAALYRSMEGLRVPCCLFPNDSGLCQVDVKLSITNVGYKVSSHNVEFAL